METRKWYWRESLWAFVFLIRDSRLFCCIVIAYVIDIVYAATRKNHHR